MKKLQVQNLVLPVKVLNRSKQPQDVTGRVGTTLFNVGDPYLVSLWGQSTEVLSTLSNTVITPEVLGNCAEKIHQLIEESPRTDVSLTFDLGIERALLDFKVAVPQVYSCTYTTEYFNRVPHHRQRISIPVIVDVLYPRRTNIELEVIVSDFLPFEFFIVETERLSVSNVFPILSSGLALDRQPRKPIDKIVADITKSLEKQSVIGSYTVRVAIQDVYEVQSVTIEESL